MVLLNLFPFFSIIPTNECVVLLVIILLVSLIIIYLRRMDFESSGSCIRLDRPQLSAQSMVKIRNPFMFSLSEESLHCDNYTKGVQLSITCDNSFWLMSYWAVNVVELHNSLSATDWQTMRRSFIDQTFMNDSILFKGEPQLYHECDEEMTHLIKPPHDFNGESLGTNPRALYPLVVIIVRNDDDDGLELDDNDVVCLITIIHLKDSICRMNTGIINQYLKQRSGHIFNLQQIYSPETDFDSENTKLCVVCQTTCISHTLLPCRHACVCGLCFERIDKCPLCRSSITSFFKICDDEDIDSNDSNTNVGTCDTSNRGWFSSIKTKLNDWLGMN